MWDTLEKNVENLREVIKEVRDYRKAVEIYNMYKRYKEKLGKPERYPLDPRKIKEDLSSEEFFKLIKLKRI
jgi:hypothetical protein